MANWNDLFAVSAGAAPIKMPKLIVNTGQLNLKNDINSVLAATSASFFDEMAFTRGSRFGAQANLLDNTNRQTIINIVSGVSGTLTHVVGATADGSNEVSIFVTASGVETEYKFYNVGSSDRPILGGALKMNPQTAASTVGTSMLGAADAGWSPSSADVGLISEDQCIFMGIGIPFTESLKVEVQYSVGVIVSTSQHTAAVTYVRD